MPVGDDLQEVRYMVRESATRFLLTYSKRVGSGAAAVLGTSVCFMVEPRAYWVS